MYSNINSAKLNVWEDKPYNQKVIFSNLLAIYLYNLRYSKKNCLSKYSNKI